ncbi:TVP38/TMEM64 family protein [Sulfuriflexus mobilis]|uniref:TVP38/TMEM64 family protein n=1 Tax=Sulfuriflexus mobilis TaxID=1811807 RepID=UPI0018D5428C|nr:TVP38/TMEM64 family protein [Sulfuriflexus mobilis]
MHLLHKKYFSLGLNHKPPLKITMPSEHTHYSLKRLIYIGILIVVFIAFYLALKQTGTLNFLEDSTNLKSWIERQGPIGPLLIIGLMMVAIIMSPIPSAPIALAAGAIYGHTTGTIYIVIGSVLGATTAFFIARIAGIDITRRWLGDRYGKGLIGSQNMLMAIIFISRLLPFISFDMISYAAGVTSLSFWRFAIATIAGIIPASFLLAHFGSELASAESYRIGLTILLLSVISVILFVIRRFSAQ